jgi:hypothetical protein
MSDLSKYNLKYLFGELTERRLADFFSEYAFKDRADYEAQTPTIFPLGQLHYMGGDGLRGGGNTWTNDDETIIVNVNRDGIVTHVREKPN